MVINDSICRERVGEKGNVKKDLTHDQQISTLSANRKK